MSEPLPKNAPVPIMRSMEASPFRNIAAIRVSSAPPIPTNIPAHSPKVWMKCENTGMATKSSCAVAAAYTFSRRFHQIWKLIQPPKAEPGNEGDHEPDQNKRGDHPASAVPKQVVVNGHYQQYDGCQQVEDRQDRIQPAEGFAEKLTGVDILEYRVEKRGKLVVFHTH